MSHAAARSSRIPGGTGRRAARGWPLQRAWHRARLDLAAWCCRRRTRSRSTLRRAPASSRGTSGESRVVSVDMRVDACRAIRSHTRGRSSGRGRARRAAISIGDILAEYFLETLEHLTLDEGRRALRKFAASRVPGGDAITTPNYRSHWCCSSGCSTVAAHAPLAQGNTCRARQRALARARRATGWRVCVSVRSICSRPSPESSPDVAWRCVSGRRRRGGT